MIEVKSLFDIVNKDDTKVTIALSNKNHPIFQAHFPNDHLLPGFCHIDILADILKDTITKVNLLKLKRKTLPEDIISYEIVTSGNKRKVKILNTQNQIIGNFSYEF